jgi:hypothetical protein
MEDARIQYVFSLLEEAAAKEQLCPTNPEMPLS